MAFRIFKGKKAKKGVSRKKLYRSLNKVIGRRLRRYHKIKAIGKHHVPDDGALLIPNHGGQLYHDAFCIAATLPDKRIRFVAHSFDFKIPGVKQFLEMFDTIRLEEHENHVHKGSEAVCALKNGEYICHFPEESYHSFNDKYTLFHFEKKFCHYARHSGKPVIPIAVIGAEEAFRHVNGPKFRDWPLHIPFGLWIPKKEKIIIEFGKPVYYTKKHTPESFKEKVRDRILELMKKHRPESKKSNRRYIKVGRKAFSFRKKNKQ